MTDLIETIARAIADADKEDYMEDCRRYDDRARAAIAAIGLAGFSLVPADMAREIAEVDDFIEAAHKNIRAGARRPCKKFKL